MKSLKAYKGNMRLLTSASECTKFLGTCEPDRGAHPPEWLKPFGWVGEEFFSKKISVLKNNPSEGIAFSETWQARRRRTEKISSRKFSCSEKAMSERGFTMIEMLIVTALIAVLLGMSMLIGFDSISRSSVAGERDLFVSLLSVTRAKALANVDEVKHGVRIEADKFILFKNTPYSASNSGNRVVKRNDKIIFTNPAGTNDPYEIVFEQLSADVSLGAGTSTLSGGGQRAEVAINSFGRIDW